MSNILKYIELTDGTTLQLGSEATANIDIATCTSVYTTDGGGATASSISLESSSADGLIFVTTPNSQTFTLPSRIANIIGEGETTGLSFNLPISYFTITDNIVTLNYYVLYITATYNYSDSLGYFIMFGHSTSSLYQELTSYPMETTQNYYDAQISSESTLSTSLTYTALIYY